MRRVRVVQPDPPEEAVRPEVLAEAIVQISRGVERLNASGLNSEAVIILLSASSSVSRLTCRHILTHLAGLEQKYTRTGKR